jgi:DNA repair protein RecO (recombination protein O)
MSGFYVNELLMRLLHRHDPHPLLFDEYSRVLQQLSILSEHDARESTANVSEQRFLRIFEKNLLRELGYGLVLDHDVVTGKGISKDGYYDYFLDSGPVLRADVSDASKDRPDGHRCISLSGHSLISLALDELSDDRSLLESKRLMRAVLKQYLGEKPLGSRRLFRSFVHASKIHNLDTTSM